MLFPSLASRSAPLHAVHFPVLPGWLSCRKTLKTLYLFTKSDFKSILFPVVAFAYAASSQPSLPRLARTATWVWLFLLQFCISNQSLSPDEDGLNKPWRPIPAQRISIPAAKLLRVFLVPLCLACSYAFDVMAPGLLLTLAIFCTNELRCDKHWLTRNATNALGYFSFEVAASSIMSGYAPTALPKATLSALITNTLIILTTIHAQDFRDEAGDRLQGRSTLPIAMPNGSRAFMPVLLSLWPIVLQPLYNLSSHLTITLLAISLFVGGRFFYLRNARDDEMSYLFYNVWLCAIQISMLVRM